MEILLKRIRQEVSFEDNDVTNILVMEVASTGEMFLAIVDDAVVKRLVEIRAGITEPAPSEPLPERGLDLQDTPMDDEGAVIFGGAVPEPHLPALAYAPTEPAPAVEPLPLQAKSVEQQLREIKTKKVDINARYNGGPTVAKDDLGYPIVPKLQRAPIVKDGDEDGIGQA